MKVLVMVLMLMLSMVTAYADQPTTVLTKLEQTKKLTLQVPVINGTNNEVLEKAANRTLEKAMDDMAKLIKKNGRVDYKVMLNRPTLVSVLLKAQDGNEVYYKGINIDLTTGKEFGLSDILQDGMARREILPQNFTEVLFGEEGVYTNTAVNGAYTGYTPYAKLMPSMRIGEAGRLVKVWRLTRECEDLTINVKPGSLLALRLKSNPTTGYKWDSEVKGGTGNLYVIGSSFTMGRETKSGMTGVPGIEIIVFAAQTPGLYTVDMNYKRPWEKNKGVEGFKFQVNVEESAQETVADIK